MVQEAVKMMKFAVRMKRVDKIRKEYVSDPTYVCRFWEKLEKQEIWVYEEKPRVCGEKDAGD